jgi:hypothetical protein
VQLGDRGRRSPSQQYDIIVDSPQSGRSGIFSAAYIETDDDAEFREWVAAMDAFHGAPYWGSRAVEDRQIAQDTASVDVVEPAPAPGPVRLGDRARRSPSQQYDIIVDSPQSGHSGIFSAAYIETDDDAELLDWIARMDDFHGAPYWGFRAVEDR